MSSSKPMGVVLAGVWLLVSGVLGMAAGVGIAFQFAALARWIGFLGVATQAYEGLFVVLGLVKLVVGAMLVVLGWMVLDGRPAAWPWAPVAAAASAVSGLLLAFAPTFVGWPFVGAMAGLLVLAVLDVLALVYLLSAEAKAHFVGGTVAEGTVLRRPPAPPPVTVIEPRPPAATELLRPPQPVSALLVVKGGRDHNRQYGVYHGSTTIGRDGGRCQVVLDDATVSGEHAKIRVEQGQFFIYDLASVNGTSVNGRRTQRQLILDGDEIKLGAVVLKFRVI